MQGGEIFVPHLPSARVLDIAGLIAPDAIIQTIGLRQGEKLHEVMVVPEESGRTYDQGWAYVVYPAFHSWRQNFPMTGSPVESGWLYSSASALRLGGSDLKNMIGL
jgi:UDP-N-acetylglucosamine 4,6-dehydratase